MKRFNCAVCVLGLIATASADEPTNDPAVELSFVNVERFDATTRFGIDGTWLDSVFSKLTRYDVHGQYVDRTYRVGGFVGLPLTIQSDKEQTEEYDNSPRTVVGGNLRFGAIWAPRVPLNDLGLIAHAGVALSNGTDDPNSATWLSIRSVALRPHELYSSLLRYTTANIGVSALVRRESVFARLDLGLDVVVAKGDVCPCGPRPPNLTPGDDLGLTPGIHANAAIGMMSRFNVAFAVEVSTITVFIDDFKAQGFEMQPLHFDQTDLDMVASVALSVRYRLGRVQLLGAYIVPLRERPAVSNGVTLGIEAAL